MEINLSARELLDILESVDIDVVFSEYSDDDDFRHEYANANANAMQDNVRMEFLTHDQEAELSALRSELEIAHNRIAQLKNDLRTAIEAVLSK